MNHTSRDAADDQPRPAVEAPPRHIAVLLLPAFSQLGLAAVIEPLAIANWLSQRTLFQWTLLSLDGQPVPASNGLSTAVSGCPEAEQGFDVCLVIASFDVHKHSRNPSLKSWLRKQALFGAVLMGVETGTELLAAAGVLDGHEAAVHWDNLQGFQESYPRVKARPQLYTLERQRLTCAGATSTLDMMIGWLGQSVDSDLAREIAMHLLMGRLRQPMDNQLDDGLASTRLQGAKMRRAVMLMEQALEEPLDCEAIARQVGLSQRQLERQFKQHTGLSPLKYYMTLRLARAHSLLQQTQMSVAQVAACSGFGSLEHFSRTYRARFGCPPSEDRSQVFSAPVMRQPLSREPRSSPIEE
ncbi:GlxA family transcriptional regulator [Pseudomonas gingeri]|uniref:GlxA family transcriptional regulator n=1 Tax=Pseudomonas gingeri TaxID=117681 RepID=A0A7Y8CNT6_9PSED|nr:GlxA family transcriptional regulator [Pseudomonas gingeri]NWA03601.1 GlxA family transcriptional regulator [Pseudomonas gingeri]NWA14459.1 GlxA family transcriptional regulator [Pseudomonas gingeri]NWA54923.1 GlxA family transcriptional regulator [Pseudomonas gingeri]NWA94647.1 GlxA family transcriptional regulator [Pseudomonas gingeri]NWB01303.1 GlxA family transcriptional regulator [Pseudomonas gingeri]